MAQERKERRRIRRRERRNRVVEVLRCDLGVNGIVQVVVSVHSYAAGRRNSDDNVRYFQHVVVSIIQV